jgi:uncharacterized protein YegP (UPF0339 family)
MFEIHDSKDGKFFVIIKAANGETLMTSETLESKQNAKKNIKAVIKRCREARILEFEHSYIEDKTESACSLKK